MKKGFILLFLLAWANCAKQNKGQNQKDNGGATLPPGDGSFYSVCKTTDDCKGGLYCAKDEKGLLFQGVCSLECKDDEECKRFGLDVICWQGFCVKSCLHGRKCPSSARGCFVFDRDNFFCTQRILDSHCCKDEDCPPPYKCTVPLCTEEEGFGPQWGNCVYENCSLEKNDCGHGAKCVKSNIGDTIECVPLCKESIDCDPYSYPETVIECIYLSREDIYGYCDEPN
jgi:hypothetical protein